DESLCLPPTKPVETKPPPLRAVFRRCSSRRDEPVRVQRLAARTCLACITTRSHPGRAKLLLCPNCCFFALTAALPWSTAQRAKRRWPRGDETFRSVRDLGGAAAPPYRG